MSLGLSAKALAVKPSSTLAITARAKELKAQGIDVVGFGAGEPDFDTPANIREAAKKAIDDGFTRYTPASGIAELREAVCKKFRDFNGLEYTPAQIVISNGGKHSLTNIFTAILDPGDEVIIPAPYWLSYPEMVKLAGGVPVFVYTDAASGFRISASQIEQAVTDRTKAIVLNTPNNPTGMIYSEEDLRAIAEVAVRRDFYVVADEMYEYLIYGSEKHVSIASFGPEIYERTITCSGLSMSYAMTGWRIGYIGAPLPVAKAISAIQSHQTSNINSVAQKAALEALEGPQDFIPAMREEFNNRREYMYARLSGMKHVSILEPKGAFYAFVNCSDVFGKSYDGSVIASAAEMAAVLLDKFHVAVVPCADFGYPEYIRLSYALSLADINKGLDRIEEFLDALT